MAECEDIHPRVHENGTAMIKVPCYQRQQAPHI
ncbi:hypothetical protein PAHAL_1G115500 [Panicum hallii]|uniref:Uncharacterized protein n=1 Tax=Panicum hallii TaxID=206008 RepID=A0A2S3GN34_9POAL|nr:hypothetical protein PAHAL_1G115500 [Panicum hallii]